MTKKIAMGITHPAGRLNRVRVLAFKPENNVLACVKHATLATSALHKLQAGRTETI